LSKNTKQFWNFVRNSADSGSEATLYIYGDIVASDWGEWGYSDDVVPSKFRDELNEMGDVATINVRINSGGGSVFGAYAIMNLLKAHAARIIVHIDGIAASAATLIAMAGDKIIAALGSVFMVHLPSSLAWGNAIEMQKQIDVLNTITDTMVDVYHAKTGIDKTEIKKMLDEDTWMSGSEAKEKGFVDEVEKKEVSAYISADAGTVVFNGLDLKLDGFRNKERIVAMLTSKSGIPVQNEATRNANISSTEKHKEENAMNLAELQAKHPQIYAEAVNVGKAQAEASQVTEIANAVADAVSAERARIKDIYDMSVPGTEAVSTKAMFETGITAAEYAVDMMKAQKQKGAEYLANAKDDAKELDDIPAAGARQDDASEEESLLAHAAEVAKTTNR